MQHTITQIIPAVDWFYVQPAPPMSSGAKFYVRPLAAFGLDHTGDLVGFFASADKPDSLVQIPALEGRFRHLRELTDAEIESMRTRGRG